VLLVHGVPCLASGMLAMTECHTVTSA